MTNRTRVHPSGRIIVLERDCDWRENIFQIENQMKIAGWVHFVVFAETFSGRFRLECVENHNKYLKGGYISTYFDKTSNESKSKIILKKKLT